MEQFLVAIHSISSELEPHKVAEKIIQETCRLLDAERASLFMVDGDELVLSIGKAAKNIRLPKTRGIAGHVAVTGETLNIPDAHADPRFDPSHDLATGFRTRNVLAAPIKDHASQEVIGVLQVINKQGVAPHFSDMDVLLLQNIAFHCGVVLRNAALYESARQSEMKVSSLLEIVELLHSDAANPYSLIFTLSTRAHQLVNADRCTLYLCDHSREQLVVITGDVDLRIPLSKGIAGHVAVTGEIVNIPDCYQDPRFNRDVDQKTGYRTKSMLCMPIFGDKRDASRAATPTPSSSALSPLSGDRSLFRRALAEKRLADTGRIISSSSSVQSPSPSSSRDAVSPASPATTSPAPGVSAAPASAEPEKEKEREIVGVLQLINKQDDAGFTDEDVRILRTLLKIAGPLLQRSRLFSSRAAAAGGPSDVLSIRTDLGCIAETSELTELNITSPPPERPSPLEEESNEEEA